MVRVGLGGSSPVAKPGKEEELASFLGERAAAGPRSELGNRGVARVALRSARARHLRRLCERRGAERPPRGADQAAALMAKARFERLAETPRIEPVDVLAAKLTG